MAQDPRVEFRVSLILPKGASDAAMREYIRDAVMSWSGSLRPEGWDGPGSAGDPLFYLKSSSVKVTKINHRA